MNKINILITIISIIKTKIMKIDIKKALEITNP
jgi:hypothetical protein